MTPWLRRAIWVALLLAGGAAAIAFHGWRVREVRAEAVREAAVEAGGVVARVGNAAAVARTIAGSVTEGFLEAVEAAGGLPVASFRGTVEVVSETTSGAGRADESGEDSSDASSPLYVCPDGDTYVVDPGLCGEPPVRVVRVCPEVLGYTFEDPPGASRDAARAWLRDPDVFSAGGETLRLRQAFDVSGALVADAAGGAVGDVDLQEVDRATGRPLVGSTATVRELNLTVDTSTLVKRPRWDVALGVTLASWPAAESESCRFVSSQESVRCRTASEKLLDSLRVRVEVTRWRGRRLWIFGEPGLRLGLEAESGLGSPSASLMLAWRR